MRALLLVDLQYDFCPGGALAVPRGDETIEVARRLVPRFPTVVATQDWHPADHGSFAANHPGAKPGQVIELEGLSQEDREFEVARAFVRFAEKATRIAAQAPPTNRPADAARKAAARAAEQHLPGLLAVPSGGSGPRARQHSGRWVRQGNDIVVHDA